MRIRLLQVVSLPTFVAIAVLSLWQGGGIAGEPTDHAEVATNPPVEKTEAGCDSSDREGKGDEKTPDSKQAAKEGGSKQPANNENLFLMLLQVLRSSK